MFHYTYVLFLSLVVLIPVNTDRSIAIVAGGSAALGLAYSSVILFRIMRTNMISDIDDHLAYGAGPVAGYLAALAAAVFMFYRSGIGPPLLAGALILLLLVNIRNAWDLTVFFALRRKEGESANSNRP